MVIFRSTIRGKRDRSRPLRLLTAGQQREERRQLQRERRMLLRLRRQRTNRRLLHRKDNTIKYDISHCTIERIVRDIVKEKNPQIRLKKNAVTVLHRECERFMIEWFNQLLQCAAHSNRVTILKEDLVLLKHFH